MTEQHKKTISKFLSLILRHEPQKIDLLLDEFGWAEVNELMTKSAENGHSFSMEELEEVVSTNDKKRFTFNDDKTKIRANQGHSINIDLALLPTTPPTYLYHGTGERFVSSIMEQGIKKMSRQYVHLSNDKVTATKVGSRHGKPIVLTILSGKMFEDGVIFYLSDNGVWLTDNIPVKYISK